MTNPTLTLTLTLAVTLTLTRILTITLNPNPNPRQAERRFGARGLGLLVNNVGTNLRKPSTEYTDAEYEMLHATNQAPPPEP